MTTAAGYKPRITEGYTKVPNSLIENQVLLSAAERALALIVFRGTSDRESRQVSDRHWREWTGLSPRMKEYAIKGLRDKGLESRGQGDQARYWWTPQTWENFVRSKHAPPELRTRKAAAVKPPLNMLVHPECAGGECLRMADEGSGLQTQTGPQLVQLPPNYHPSWLPLPAIPENFPLSYRQLRSVFPGEIGPAFLKRLIDQCRDRHRETTDDRISWAVEIAWKKKRHRQQSPGLFLETVPDALDYVEKTWADPLRECTDCAGSGKKFPTGFDESRWPDPNYFQGTDAEFNAAIDKLEREKVPCGCESARVKRLENTKPAR